MVVREEGSRRGEFFSDPSRVSSLHLARLAHRETLRRSARDLSCTTFLEAVTQWGLPQSLRTDLQRTYRLGRSDRHNFDARVISAIAVFVYKSPAKIPSDRLIFLAMFSVLLMPSILPKMHDRYFFPADVIAIVFAFYWPRCWYTLIVVISASLVAYMKFLTRGWEIISLSWAVVFLAALIVVLGRELLRIFREKPSSARNFT